MKDESAIGMRLGSDVKNDPDDTTVLFDDIVFEDGLPDATEQEQAVDE